MRTTWLLLLFRADSTAKVWLSDVDLTASLASCCELSVDCILVSRRNTMKLGGGGGGVALLFVGVFPCASAP